MCSICTAISVSLILFFWKPPYPPKLSKHDQSIVLKNYSIWKSLTPNERKNWLLKYKRFRSYSGEDREFLLRSYERWNSMPEAIKRNWRHNCKVFCQKNPEQRQKTLYTCIANEYLNYKRMHPFKNINLVRCNVEKLDTSQYKFLSPISLRKRIFEEMETLEALSLLPPLLQKHWLNMPVKKRIKVLEETQKKVQKHYSSLLVEELGQEQY